MQATWTKLRNGTWGVRVLGEPPKRGDVITVAKRSGETGPAVVDTVIWSGVDRDTGEPLAVCAVLTVHRGPRVTTSRAKQNASTPADVPTKRASGFRGARRPAPPPQRDPNDYIDTVGETIAPDATPTFVF